MSPRALPLVLVVDDEPQIQRFLKPALTAAGYSVAQAPTGGEAMRMATTLSPTIVILDLGLPDMDGKDVIAGLRTHSDVPIIVLSARDRETEKIAALDLGANDFVNKPFGIGELLARLRVATRARGALGEATPVLQAGDLVVDVPAHRAMRAGEPLRLTPKEFDLLHFLASNANKPVPHRKLLQTVWGPDYGEEVEYLRVVVNQLRRKIEPVPAKPRYLLTEPWVGYRLALPG